MSELVSDSVSYAYKGSNCKTVNEVSAHFEEGNINAIIGPSGSDKTFPALNYGRVRQPNRKESIFRW